MPLKAQPRVGYHSLFALSHRERMMGKLTSGKASGLAGATRGAFLHHATWPRCRAASANGPSNYRTRLPAGEGSPGKLVVDAVQRSSANLEAGRYLVRLEMSLPTTPICVSVEAGEGVVSEDRTRLLEFQIAT